ncbi:MAG: HesB/IscA family protein [Alphaproteobacteria bacterium]|jgi:iron-sulfur cluster assembly protein|nr:iron-sulfur cluster assembly accessory protein [Candidatus Jidaibacter sp.]
MSDRLPIIKVTSVAAERVRFLLGKRDKASLGIRVGVKSGGCSGLSYTFEYCDVENPADEKIVDQDVTVFIDAKAVLYLIGTTLDYVDEKTKSGFVFVNPNEKGKCGCGESFHV